jgi:hypothetical protein
VTQYLSNLVPCRLLRWHLQLSSALTKYFSYPMTSIPHSIVTLIQIPTLTFTTVTWLSGYFPCALFPWTAEIPPNNSPTNLMLMPLIPARHWIRVGGQARTWLADLRAAVLARLWRYPPHTRIGRPTLDWCYHQPRQGKRPLREPHSWHWSLMQNVAPTTDHSGTGPKLLKRWLLLFQGLDHRGCLS